MCLFARGALFFIFPDKWLVNIADPPTRPLFYYVAFLLPGQIYFTTYTLLILFWAEIYHQVSPVLRALPSIGMGNGLTPSLSLSLSLCVSGEVSAAEAPSAGFLRLQCRGVRSALGHLGGPIPRASGARRPRQVRAQVRNDRGHVRGLAQRRRGLHLLRRPALRDAEEVSLGVQGQAEEASGGGAGGWGEHHFVCRAVRPLRPPGLPPIPIRLPAIRILCRRRDRSRRHYLDGELSPLSFFSLSLSFIFLGLTLFLPISFLCPGLEKAASEEDAGWVPRHSLSALAFFVCNMNPL